MRFQVLNYGSLNIDHVYQVPHFVAPGETLSADGYTRNAGGKGRVAPAGKWSAVALRALEPPCAASTNAARNTEADVRPRVPSCLATAFFSEAVY